MSGQQNSLKIYLRISLSSESFSARGKGNSDYYLKLCVFMKVGQGWVIQIPDRASALLANPRLTFIFTLSPIE